MIGLRGRIDMDGPAGTVRFVRPAEGSTPLEEKKKCGKTIESESTNDRSGSALQWRIATSPRRAALKT